ncbi:Oxysterol [Podosphaera aphanis]|nr:Oxysterol [Podosphaera aphanis]
MSDPSEAHHRRSKSSAFSLLRRKDGIDDGDISEEVQISPTPVTGQSSVSLSHSVSRSYNQKPPPGSASLMRASPILPNTPSKTMTIRAPTPEKTVSIEQAIKKFRTFEALRSGDTALISKLIRESDNQNPPSSKPCITLEDTTILHLAIQCAELPVVQYVLSDGAGTIDLNARDSDGNTPLHLAVSQSRAHIVRLLLQQPEINDSIVNYQGKTPLDLARSPEIFQQLQHSRSKYEESKVKQIQELVREGDYKGLGKLLEEPRSKMILDINGGELASDAATIESGGTLLHEAARKKDTSLIQVLFLHGADPFRRDRKGKLPQDVTKDEVTRAMLKRSPEAVAAQRGIQEKSVLGSALQQGIAHISPSNIVAGKEGREMKGYLKKWTNYRRGYQLRWFVLEDGVLSYYKYQEDAGSACRGAINMRIANIHMDPAEKTRFDIIGKSSVKYNLKANHEVEAKRWFWALNNSIQWTKDQAKEEERQRQKSSELLRATKVEHSGAGSIKDISGDQASESTSIRRNSSPGNYLTSSSVKLSKISLPNGSVANEDEIAPSGSYEHSFAGENGNLAGNYDTPHLDVCHDDDDDESYSDREILGSKDAFDTTAQSAKLQLELIGHVNGALQAEQLKTPDLPLSDPSIISTIQTLDSSIRNLKYLVGDLLKISRDRDAHWQYRIDCEVNMRRMWEENMAAVAREQEALEARFGEVEKKRKLTKRALQDVIESTSAQTIVQESRDESQNPESLEAKEQALPNARRLLLTRNDTAKSSLRTKTLLAKVGALSETESDEEFFDAIDAGAVEVAPKLLPPPSPAIFRDEEKMQLPVIENCFDISPSFKGYEDGSRKKLKLDNDDRPKVSLWGILKSMIGKDMTKMTLPVSFNEPTSLLQRCAEDMEYAELLDIAAAREDATERMVYVAAFAISEYASTIGRVAKPFNPLLGETFEYVRPDKNYRFFIEQVSHHPPIGAAWAESARWTYWGESAVKSKFYGKSMDINPLGTWFLRLKPENSEEELYTWKKVTTSVVGIITGSPTLDNYGLMEIKNWNTGETCAIDFKSRGWKASSAYQIAGHVNDANGQTRYSIGGRWNNKIYARLTPGYEATVEEPKETTTDPSQAFLVWEANPRPSGIPFNLTPFVITLNDDNPKLLTWLPPTDSRLRPDQRAMEDGRYDEAAEEKHRVEEKQRAKRREREEKGEEFVPHWFSKDRCPVTGESYWKFNGKYWDERELVMEGKAWANCERIFEVDE